MRTRITNVLSIRKLPQQITFRTQPFRDVRVPGAGDQQRAGEDFEPLMTSQDAAKLLSIHPKTLQRMARDGKVPGLRVGDLWRFRASDLDRWVRAAIGSKGHSCRN